MTNKAKISLFWSMTLCWFLSAQSIVPVTLTVDVSEQSVPSEGVYVIGNFFNGSPEPLDDNGDGTWSYSASFTAGDTLYYRFALGQELETINSTNCLFSDEENRLLVIPSIDSLKVAPVCYSHCSTCSEISTDTNDIFLRNWRFKLYPNPMKDFSSAYWYSPNDAIQSIELFSLDGQLLRTYPVLDKLQQTIPRANLASGLYLLKIQDTGGRVAIQKMVIK